MSDEFLNYEQAATLMGLPRGTLYAWVCRRQVPHHRLGKRLVRFSKSELLHWMDTCRVQVSVATDGAGQ